MSANGLMLRADKDYGIGMPAGRLNIVKNNLKQARAELGQTHGLDE